jgi:DUF4097 and DUF4098 domain-containing protein YvlB
VLLCGCLVLAGLATAPWWTHWDIAWNWDGNGVPWAASETERIEKTFALGGEPSLEVDNFAGTVIIQAQEGDGIDVVATKRTQHARDLDRITVEMEQQPGRLVIHTQKPSDLDNTTVKLEIAAPAGTRLVIRSGAGTVDVRGLQASLEVQNGAGTVAIRDAAGVVAVNSGAGTIEYQGRPVGDCRFWSGAGTITLRVPRDLDMEVDLSTSMGTVHSDFGVSGQVSMRSIRGAIGTGDDARITARSEVGTVTLDRQ